MSQTIDKLLLVALKPEWSFLKQNYSFKLDAQLKNLHHIEGTDVALLQLGVGPDQALKSWMQFLEIHSVGQVLHFGLSGALNKNLKVGDLLSPSQVVNEENFVVEIPSLKGVSSGRLVTVKAPLKNQNEKQDFATRFKADLVDMETFSLINLAQERRIIYQSLRGIFDELSDDIADLGEPYSPEGDVQASKIALNLIKNPSLIFKLPPLQKRVSLIQKKMKPVIEAFIKK